MNAQHIWDEPFPDRIYKYMERGHATTLCERGELRLLGLESYDSDPDEGRAIAVADEVTSEQFQGHGQAASNIRANMAGLVSFSPSAARNTIQNCTFEDPLGNFLVYCTSMELSSDAMSRCNEAPGVGGSKYDTCVEVFDVPAFAAALTDAISARMRKSVDCVAGRVKYTRREHSIRELPRTYGLQRAFIKPPGHESGHEYRLLWTCAISAMTPLDLVCPAVTRFCRLRDIPA